MMTREQMKMILQLRTMLEEFIKEDDFVESINTILVTNMISSEYISDELKTFITNELNNGSINIPASHFFDKNAQKTINSSVIMKNIGNYALYNTHKVAYDFSDVIATPEHGILIDLNNSHDVYCDREDNFLLYDGNFYNAIYSMGMKDFIDLFDSSEIQSLNRIYKALIAEYSPIENVDEYEDITDTRTPSLTEAITQTENSTRTPSLTEAITQTENSTRTPSLTEAITQTESSTRTPNLTEIVNHDSEDNEIPNVTETTTYNITESPKSTELTGDAGYNSAVTYENHRVVSGGSNIKNGSEAVKQAGRKTVKHGGSDTTTTIGSEDNSSKLTSSKTSLGNEKNENILNSSKTSLGNETNQGLLGSVKTSSGKEDLVHVKRRHGNIGVTMSQQLIEAELRLRKQNFYGLMFEMLANKLFSKIYR